MRKFRGRLLSAAMVLTLMVSGIFVPIYAAEFDETISVESQEEVVFDDVESEDVFEDGIIVEEPSQTAIMAEDELFQTTENVMMLSESNIYDVISRDWTGYQDGQANGESIRRTVDMHILDINSAGEFHAEKSIYQNNTKMCSYFVRGTLTQDGTYVEMFMFYVNNPNQWGKPSDYSGVYDFSTRTISGTNSNGTFSYSSTEGTNAVYLEKIKSNANDYSKVPANWIGYQDGSSGSASVRRKVEMKIDSVDGNGNFIAKKTVTGESGSVSYYVNGKIRTNGTYSDLFKIYSNNPSGWGEQSVYSGIVYDDLKCIQGETEWGEFFYVKEGDENAEYVSDLGFTLGINNNNFVHTSSSTWEGAGFEGVTDYTIDDEYFNRLTAGSSKSEKNKIKKQMKQKWEGSCYGIAMSMGLLYEKYIGISDLTDEKLVENYHSMSYPCNNDKLLNMINYYQLSQNLENGGKKTSAVSAAYNNGWFTGLVNWVCSYDSLSVCLKKLVNYSSSNHVELLGFSTSSGGHAVLVTGCEYDEDTEQYKVQIYDENSVDSATSKGIFSYMNIAKDFSSFSYTDSNGDIVNDKTYIAIYFLDWNSLGNIVSTAKKTSSGHAKLDFLLGDDFKAVNADGDYIQYNNSGFIGDMNIYDISTVDLDNGVHIIIETDDTGYVTLSKLDSNVDIEYYNDEDFLAIQGENLDGAKLTLGDGIELQGDSYSFTAFVGMDELNENEDGLLSVSADANSDATIIKQDNELEVKSTDILSNIMTTDYVGTETEKQKHNDTDNFNVTPGDIKEKSSSSISLKDKTVTFSGKGVSIDKAVVIGSTGNIEYEYYSDNNCKNKISSLPINVGTYYVKASVAADDNYEAASSNVAKLTINKAKITNVSLSKTKYVYNAKVQKPSVVVKDSKGNKLSASNYTIAYSKGCKSVGIYKVTITLKGNYIGKTTKFYNIIPKSTSISKVVAKSKGFFVTWKKQTTQTTGYQIQYSTSSKFSSAKTVSITKNTAVTKTITKLKGKKKYYVRMRTYKVAGGKKYYSSWSKAKYVIIKK